MKTIFRQGLISYQQAGPQAAYLAAGPAQGYVSLNVNPQPLLATIAHGDSDYLLRFDQSIQDAWGPTISGVDNYLVINQDLISGALLFQIATLEPITSLTAPTSPALYQLWFDLSATVMKMFNGTKWIATPSLVVGKVVLGNTNQIVSYPMGSSVGLNSPGSAGFLMLDSQLRPLRTSTGELLTSAAPIRIKTTVGTSGILSEPVHNFVPVRAAEPIPPMSLVYFSGEDTVSIASSNPSLTPPKIPVGIVQSGLSTNEVGVISQQGEITYDLWDFPPADFGKPLYCGWNGEITTTRPLGVQAYRVGYIKNPRTILFGIDSETKLQVVSQPGSLISAQPPLTAVTNTNGSNEIVTTISLGAATGLVPGYMTAQQADQLDSFETRISANTTAVAFLEVEKADIAHTHIIADVTGLQTNLDALSDLATSKMSKIVDGTVGNFPSINSDGTLLDSGYAYSAFALVGHVHTIADVTNLQTILDAKANIIHTHVIADVTGLQIELNNRAFVNHTHSMSDISGLQTALNTKAPLNHTHEIIDINALQEQLDLRALVGHTHSISDVINLQTTLNDKAEVAHVHTAANVTDFSEAVDDRVAALLQAGEGITLQYLGAGNQLVISSSADGAPSVHTLDELDDVVINAPENGDVLTYNGTEWVPAASAGGGGGGGGGATQYRPNIFTFWLQAGLALNGYIRSDFSVSRVLADGTQPSVEFDDEQQAWLLNEAGIYKIESNIKVSLETATFDSFDGSFMFDHSFELNSGYFVGAHNATYHRHTAPGFNNSVSNNTELPRAMSWGFTGVVSFVGAGAQLKARIAGFTQSPPPDESQISGAVASTDFTQSPLDEAQISGSLMITYLGPNPEVMT